MGRHLRYVMFTALACLLLGIIGMATDEHGIPSAGESVSAGYRVPGASTEAGGFHPGQVPWIESVSGPWKDRSPLSSQVGLIAFCIDGSRQIPVPGSPVSCDPGTGPDIVRNRNDSPRSPVVKARRPR